ncbi:hypothetical protein PACTADRAFT_48983 [Pachysolen tannophilus NRRL Y-2460]|uniref:Inositol polyphosphate-related phosphatase domain-containing protein n=1 Tax=Pachysolen tannophilus NRRL Y-2460 TaxID=669874 RepID=A0A1E4TZR4_PACTA|nr:hypothetical protein PACTADRAFT_48983 [Pachysolen tannophilus NRRL Y-2460]
MSVPIYILTFNCNKNFQNPDAIISTFSKSYPVDPFPEFFVFGFQEVCSILDSTSFEVVNNLLIELNETLIKSLRRKYGREYNFQTVSISHVGAIGLIIITPFLSKISNIKIGNCSCGIFASSLKGGCGIRFNYKTTDLSSSTFFTFCNCHLAALEGERNLQKRNQDVLTLMKGIDFGDGFGLIKPKNHCFFIGDLNYRATARIFNNTITDNSNEDRMIDENEELIIDIDKDELNLCRKNNEVFIGFDEPNVKFKPTYKYILGTQEYNMKRIPSWCDRILYQSYNTDSNVIVHKYDSISISDSGLLSDHQPVYLSISVPMDPPINIINTHGYLSDVDGINIDNVYLKPSNLDKARRILTFISDSTIGYALYSIGTTKGRFITIIGLIIFYFF